MSRLLALKLGAAMALNSFSPATSRCVSACVNDNIN